jgi:DNA-binding response OmpR family regulator
MREKKVDTPVIMLSALSEVEDKVRELDNGADDYLAKPFKTKELVARICALMRRPTVMKNKKTVYEDFEFDEATKELNGIQLTAKEAALLIELLRVPGKLISKEHLLSKIWGEDGVGEDNYVEAYVSRVRKILKNAKSKVKIKAVRGLGYKLC